MESSGKGILKWYRDWLKANVLGSSRRERSEALKKKTENSVHPGYKAGDPIEYDASWSSSNSKVVIAKKMIMIIH